MLSLPHSSNPSLLPPLGDLRHLQRLSVILNGGGSVPEPDFDAPLFAGITHLEIITNKNSWTTWSPYWSHRLPALTHLALGFKGDARAANINSFQYGPPSLKVFAILAHNDFVSRASLYLVRENFDDPRVVVMPEGEHTQNWLHGLRGESDMWAFAEAMVVVQSDDTSS